LEDLYLGLMRTLAPKHNGASHIRITAITWARSRSPVVRRYSPSFVGYALRPAPEERRMSDDRTGRGESIDLSARRRAYELVRAVLSDVHDQEHRAAAARSVAVAVLAEAGIDGMADVAVDLSLRCASALERIAADQGLAAVDLAEVWFVD
jgi:hypothetical protein